MVCEQNKILMPFFLLFGLYSITSLNHATDVNLYFFQCGILLISLLMLIRYQISYSLNMLLIAIGIHAVLWIYTGIAANNPSFSGTLTAGSYIPYIIFSLILIANFKDVQLGNSIIRVFNAVNVANIILAVLIIQDFSSASEFISNYYTFGNERVMKEMMFYNKPVMTFGTHSIASFYCFVFFYLNLKTYLVTKLKINFVFCLTYLGVMIFLYSHTGVIYLALALFLLLFYTKKFKWVLIAALPFLVSAVNLNNNISFIASGGIAARYSDAGVLQHNLNFIVENPFNGVGLFFNDTLYDTDSGLILYLLRGSLPLAILIYFGFFMMLKRNLHSRKAAWFIWFLFMSFDLGFPNLFYIRTLYIVPFLIVYLNFLERLDGLSRPALSSR